jgi:hypothetical protein
MVRVVYLWCIDTIKLVCKSVPEVFEPFERKSFNEQIDIFLRPVSSKENNNIS